MPTQAMLGATRTAPHAIPPCAAQRAPRLDGLLDRGGRFDHPVEHRGTRAHPTEACTLGTWVDTNHQDLLARVLHIGQLNGKPTQFVALWASLAGGEQGSRFAVRKRAQRGSPHRPYRNSHGWIASLLV